MSAAAPPLAEGVTPVGAGAVAGDEVLEGYDDPSSERDQARGRTRASALLAAAGGLVVIAWFFPLLEYAGGLVVIAWFFPLLEYAADGFVWRFGIWG